MKYLRVFKTESQYKAYCKGNDVWLPRIAYVVTDYKNSDGTTSTGAVTTAPDDYDSASHDGMTWAQYIDSSISWDKTIMDRTSGWVDWRVLNTEFMRVANGGVCYLTDTNKVVAPGTQSDDASAWLEVISYDPSTDTSYCRLCISTKNSTDSTVCYMENTFDSSMINMTPVYVEKVHAYNYDF